MTEVIYLPDGLAEPEPDPTPVIVDPLAGTPPLLAAAMRRRGFTQLTSVQRAVLDAESEGRDLRISSQTGSGKTVAIGLALAGHLALNEASSADRRGPSVLVLVPTRELAMQVREELVWLFEDQRGIRVEVVMGGTSLSLERRALSRRPQIVVGTPGRVLDHLKTGALVCDSLQHAVLDESDRMLDMGFREELEAILGILPAERRSHLVSATFPNQVRKLADRFQKNALHIEGTRLGDANSDIEHHAHLVDRKGAYAALVNLLLLNEGGRCLIFVERRVDATALAERLSGDSFPVQSFSGELAQAQRTRTINAFRDGTIKTLVSTDVAARGIDVPNIELVIHMDLPADADSYVHRSGRTGRAGRSGQSVALVPPHARGRLTRLFAMAKVDAKWGPAPNASKVHKHLRRQFRALVHARLGSEAPPSQSQVDYAKGLLDGREPAAVVAMLLEMAQPIPARAPMEVGEAAALKAPPPRDLSAGYVRFSINWGERNGAATNRLLGHICRRGKINGHEVGAIDIGPEGSTFDVEAGVAERFGKLVRIRDSRDPHLRINRVGDSRGSRGSAGRPVQVSHAAGSPSNKPFGPKKKFGSKKPFGAKKRSGPKRKDRT